MFGRSPRRKHFAPEIAAFPWFFLTCVPPNQKAQKLVLAGDLITLTVTPVFAVG